MVSGEWIAVRVRSGTSPLSSLNLLVNQTGLLSPLHFKWAGLNPPQFSVLPQKRNGMSSCKMPTPQSPPCQSIGLNTTALAAPPQRTSTLIRASSMVPDQSLCQQLHEHCGAILTTASLVHYLHYHDGNTQHFPPNENNTNDPILLKKLQKGEGRYSTQKCLLGFDIDSNNKTL